ncbi:hypothetical protein GLOTRDRAFT_50028 [Gloeophyllum trabeum ATCC 11539]|uniref:MYND-type domain-containing protein n=1 Tax=Gloeophyllum trabeum (strain ATCC 11539 / FP-39264 / Madison 617) TaxID=670483 RepID=S7R9I9_GLOTA|nr:uncharacterized protein GLOTRDRAFT_50028 [Gloeophyllum trabeum ATCC 11539]EPQ50935.1 hypothetical protein GLOTRDRAFT_50028 [Gloeophyllum trabeum ATCC 11539]
MSTINHLCTICYYPTNLYCGRCERVYYCSPEHQLSDWPRHKVECVHAHSEPPNHKQIATPPVYQQPLVSVLALLFSPEEENPRLVTVQCTPQPEPTNGLCPTPLVQTFFPDDQIGSVVLTQGLNNEHLRFPLHLFYSQSSLLCRANVNRAIQRITSEAAAKPWFGPAVVLKFNGSRRQGYSHAGANDLPTLSAYFLTYK